MIKKRFIIGLKNFKIIFQLFPVGDIIFKWCFSKNICLKSVR